MRHHLLDAPAGTRRHCQVSDLGTPANQRIDTFEDQSYAAPASPIGES
jgi:hypothetical protein